MLMITIILILGIVSIVTALKLYQTRKNAVAPTAPKEAPAQEATPGPCEFEVCIPTPSATPTATPTPSPVVCISKSAYRDEADNTANHYQLRRLIGQNDYVSRGETVVFYILTGPADSAATYTLTDVLPQTVTYVDGDASCNYQEASRTVTCTAIQRGVAFRVRFGEDISVDITNTATVVEEGKSPSTCSLTLRPAPLLCVGLDKDKANPVLNDQIVYTCRGNGTIDHFNFRYQINGGNYTEMNNIAPSATNQNQAQITIPVNSYGSWHVQCQVCQTTNNTSCTQWGEAI